MKVGKIKSKFISSSLRLNSDYHLSEGVVYDRSIKSRKFELLDKLTSDIYTAGRSKRIYVDKDFGIPYLGNSDLMSSSPLDDCNYASNKFSNEIRGYLKEGMILTGRVGQNTVGAYSYATKEIENSIGSDNVIRIISNGKVLNGYLYSFLASAYGYHLSRRHISGNAQPFVTEEMLGQIPIPILPKEKQEEIHNLIVEASNLRVEANRLLEESVAFFEERIDESKVSLGFQYGKISSGSISKFHKRFDSQYQLLWKDLKKEHKQNLEYKKMKDFASSVFVGGRGKRNYVKKGIAFLSSSDMMIYNPKKSCKYVAKNTPGINNMLVSKSDILISRSGTVGNTVIVGEDLSNTAVSEHALRLVIDSKLISPNYVFCYLKTKHGKKSMEASAFGSVIITLNEELIENIDLPIIEVSEQKIINNRIALFTEKMDSSVLKENQAITLIEKEIESWQK